MARGSQLGLRQRTSITLSPRVQLGLNLMALPQAELMTHVRAELDSNPLLVASDDWSEDFSESSGVSTAQISAFEVASQTVASNDSRGELLRRQLAEMDLEPTVKAIASYLTEDLDERGYLTISDAEIAIELRQSLRDVRASVAALQSCDPAGVGARSLSDCLRLQLIGRGHGPRTAARILDVIPDLLSRDFATAATRMPEFSVARMRQLAAEVRHLSPAPAMLSAQGPSIHREPDLIATIGASGRVDVILATSFADALSLDRQLLSRGRAHSDAREYMDERKSSAERLIAALRFRDSMLLRVGRALVDAQIGFFVETQSAPTALTRRALAERIDVHPSTVTRAVRGRRLQWKGRVYDMSWFFPTGPGATGATTLSSHEVQREIQRMVAEEPAERSLSDDDIARNLNHLGVDIARRTVAKYRRCLNIPSSRQRRRMAAEQGIARRGKVGASDRD